MASDDLPLCAKRIFLYPGDPEGAGIIGYETSQYRSAYNEIDFVDSSQFIHSLEDDLTLRDRSLLQVADGEQFHIPEYQRNYSWGEEQHQEMWETVRQTLQLKSQVNEKPSDTFFGSIYIAKSPKRDQYEIIDGQQRIATIALLLRNLGEQLEQHTKYTQGELKQYATHIKNDYIDELLYRRKGPSEIPFLSLNAHDNPWFHLIFKSDNGKIQDLREMEKYDGRKKNAVRLKKILDKVGIDSSLYQSDIPDTELNEFRYYGEAHQKLVKADQFYAERIGDLLNRDKFETHEAKIRILVNLTQYILRSLRVCECLFETEDQELRIEVFQSLNDRGIELSKMDKIRARIVGRFQGAEDSDKQIGRWENVMKEFGTDASAVEDFLAHYLAATEREFTTVTEARNNMLEAFRLRDVGNMQVESRLASKGGARSFLEELEAFASRYREIINAELVDNKQSLGDEHRERAEAILRRLDGLGTKSWRPFVMYIYQQVLEAPNKGEFFYRTLRTVESIMFRFTISPHQSTVIDSTFPKTTQEFIELEQSNRQFDADQISGILKENIDDSAREMFGENFADQLISKKGWKNNKVKQLLMKLVDEDHQRANKTGITNTSLSQDTGEVHIEHIFPESFILHSKDNPYAWLEKFFQSANQPQLNETITLLKNKKIGSVDDKSERYGDLDPIIERIRDSFVRDIGNMILLDKRVNNSIKNSLFSIKLKAYHKKHSKDMDNISNDYFTSSGEVPGSDLNTLLEMDLPDNETVSNNSKLVQDFNSWWTWERSVNRKAIIVEEFLNSILFPTDPDEFDVVFDNIKSMIKDDYNTRFTLASS
jgi:uncharacterized protein with ParB-like and HNH nuclease domain